MHFWCIFCAGPGRFAEPAASVKLHYLIADLQPVPRAWSWSLWPRCYRRATNGSFSPNPACKGVAPAAPCPHGQSWEAGHGQAATDHAGIGFFSDISPSAKHQAVAGVRGRLFMTPILPLLHSAGMAVAGAGMSQPLCPCRTTVLVLTSCTGLSQWPLQPAHFSYHSMGYRVHFRVVAIARVAGG